MFKIAVVNDDPLYSLELELTLTALKYEVLTVGTFDVATVMKVLTRESPHMVLTDVFSAKRPTGLLLAKEFAKQGIPYILYTANDAPGIFSIAERMEPYAYMVRPFDGQTLHRTIKLALAQHARRKKSFQPPLPFTAKNSNGDLVRSDLNKVVSIEAIGNYCYFHLPEGKLVNRTSLVKLMEMLPSKMFLRVHRRYLVAARKIKSVNTSKGEVYVAEHAYPFGAKYRSSLMNCVHHSEAS